jgi:hypothetical protein
MLAYGVMTNVVVIALLCLAFVASIVFGLRMKLPALGSSTPWANERVKPPRSYWVLFWLGQGCLLLSALAAVLHIIWLAISLGMVFLALIVARNVMAVALIRRARRRRAGEGQ